MRFRLRRKPPRLSYVTLPELPIWMRVGVSTWWHPAHQTPLGYQTGRGRECYWDSTREPPHYVYRLELDGAECPVPCLLPHAPNVHEVHVDGNVIRSERPLTETQRAAIAEAWEARRPTTRPRHRAEDLR